MEGKGGSVALGMSRLTVRGCFGIHRCSINFRHPRTRRGFLPLAPRLARVGERSCLSGLGTIRGLAFLHYIMNQGTVPSFLPVAAISWANTSIKAAGPQIQRVPGR